MRTSNLIHKLLKSFNDNKVTYCHWKSNEHLDDSFKGDTDFDILFDKEQRDKVKKIFSENGFCLFTPPYNRKYQQIEDYIAIDYEQNKIIHFHSHYQLIIGRSGIKEYRYKLEDKILNSRIFSPVYSCYLIDPTYELILLILRLSLKITKKWKTNFHENKEVIYSNIELKWLKERVSFEMLMDLVQELKLPYDKSDLLNIYHNNFQYEPLYSFSLQKTKIKGLIKKNQVQILGSIFIKWLYFQYGRIIRKLGISYIAKQRVKSNDGFSIAILGSDGSGKSTQSKELIHIISKKIDISSLYMGSNKGSRSRIRKVLESIRNKNLTFNLTFFDKLLTLLITLCIGLEKKIKLKKGKMLRHKGVFVLFDRFPQSQTYGFNDGPLLKKRINSTNFLSRSLARYEKKLYRPPLDAYPNLIFKLIADPKILSERRDMTIEQINQKQDSILNLTFENKSPIIIIDANKPIKEVTSNILKEIQHNWFDNRLDR